MTVQQAKKAQSPRAVQGDGADRMLFLRALYLSSHLSSRVFRAVSSRGSRFASPACGARLFDLSTSLPLEFSPSVVLGLQVLRRQVLRRQGRVARGVGAVLPRCVMSGAAKCVSAQGGCCSAASCCRWVSVGGAPLGNERGSASSGRTVAVWVAADRRSVPLFWHRGTFFHLLPGSASRLCRPHKRPCPLRLSWTLFLACTLYDSFSCCARPAPIEHLSIQRPLPACRPKSLCSACRKSEGEELAIRELRNEAIVDDMAAWGGARDRLEPPRP